MTSAAEFFHEHAKDGDSIIDGYTSPVPTITLTCKDPERMKFLAHGIWGRVPSCNFYLNDGNKKIMYTTKMYDEYEEGLKNGAS